MHTSTIARTLLAATALAMASSAVAAGLDADVTITNTTGRERTNWPVFLTVFKVFGGNLPVERINPKGFHVLDGAGNELPHMLRRLPPQISSGNDEIVFIVPRLAAGASLKVRVTNTASPGKAATIKLAGNPNNLLSGGAFEALSDHAPAGFGATVKGGAKLTIDTAQRRAGRGCLRIDLPARSSVVLRSAKPIRFAKDGRYRFSLWAKCKNVAYNGYGFWGAGGSVTFDPPALRGRSELRLRGDRAWFCYQFDPGPADAWGVPDQASRAQAATVRKGRNRVPAAVWAKAGGKAHLVLSFRQDPQPFLAGDKRGTVWLDEALLFAQPAIRVDRRKALPAAADGAFVYARPVNSPRWGPFAHEAVKSIETFAMRGQRQQVRFGVCAPSGRALEKVTVSLSPLVAPAGRLGPERLELELNNHYVEPYRPQPVKAGRWAEYLLAFDVPRDATPGRYRGTIAIACGPRGPRRKLPVALDVLPVTVPDMTGYWVGGIFNIGMGLDRNEAFYKAYAKTRFNYLMLFDYLFGQVKGAEIDLAAADKQVDQIAKIARVNGAIGLYREPNMSEDQPRKWYQIASGRPDFAGKYKTGTDARFKPGYQKLARQAHAHARKAGWPTLIYMVSDEPGDRRDVHPSMGWLNEAVPQAVTCADVQFRDMLRTWQWYNLPILDDPVDWTGPLVYRYVLAHKKRFGICGTAWSVDTARYQPGLMLPATGATYWHFWHTQGPFDARQGRVDRRYFVPAMTAGFNDLRYYVALTGRIAKAPKSPAAVEAAKYLRGILAVIPGDHDRHLMPHNGVPWMWGYDRFYDDWRSKMRDYLLKLKP